MFRRLFSVLPLLSLSVSVHAQKPLPKDDDHSREAFVIEQFSDKEKFENDGTAVKERQARVRIQSEAGVRQYALLSFSYASGTGTFEIGYVRVRKPDGSVVETPPENIQDMAAQITRQAPFYSDLHEKHVAVKGLSLGDVLEYHTAEHVTKPLAPDEFWTGYTFTREAIILDEEVEISVPRERKVKVRSATVEPAISEAGGYRVFMWHNSNLKRKDDSNDKRESTELAWQMARGRLPQFDIILSSFASWDDVGRWYNNLQQEKVKPTSEVSAKAAELTKDATTDDAKIHALYNYVSTQFHYIGVAFGIGRYQPHRAAEVLENQYGDCKDKHTLLVSLLSAVGIPAYPALISASREVDADVPSPGQFDHVITVVPRGGELVWLDTTSEVGPFRFLISPLRDKHALVIWKEKPSTLTSTPADPPFDSAQDFNMNATLDSTGTLVGNAFFSTRGDAEYWLRAAFRAVPVPQWKELGEGISSSSGFGGEVSEVTASSPEKTDEPFRFSYKYTRKDFGDWANHRILAPEPFARLLAPGEEEQLPAGASYLGPRVSLHFHSEVELPGGYRPALPAPIHLHEDFAQFDVTYDFRNGKMISDRRLETLTREVPAGERETYLKFMRAVQDDYGVYIPLLSGSSSATSSGQQPGTGMMNTLKNLPNSSNDQAAQLEIEARMAMASNDIQNAVASLHRALDADPRFTRAWVLLGGLLITKRQLQTGDDGSLLLTRKQIDDGVEAFHNAMTLDPTEPAIPKALGVSLMAASRCDDAVHVWQDFIKAYPNDIDGQKNLGSCLNQLKRYSEAAAAYQAAEKLVGNHDKLEAMAGLAYLHAGEREKAEAIFAGLGDAEQDGEALNDVAYEMATSDLNLPLALNYAQKAVIRVEQESQKIALAELKIDDLNQIFKLSAYWDTLGWVNERMSKMDTAERYLKAAWKLTQDGLIAGHLCHLYRRTHETATGIQMCQAALSRLTTSTQSPDWLITERNAAQENLDYLKRGPGKSTIAVPAADFVVSERTFKLPRFLSGTESAEFFLLFASDGKSKTFKVDDLKFISGSTKMRLQGKQLKIIDFKFPAPDSTPAHFVRRGILGCYQYTGCSLVLLDPGSVTSLN
jgi:tetratricopeptide (TPR) repeat protein/transglutaminase-like putative cysteine protease